MRGLTKSLAMVAIVAFVVTGAVGGFAARAANPTLKHLMGSNFQNVQSILIDLVTSKYTALPAKIEVIHKHALDLSKKEPASVKTSEEKKMFSSYAYQLESNTANMITVINQLILHDKTESQPGKLNIDYLRVVAARQFGEIVTTCVLCHNQFRRHSVY